MRKRDREREREMEIEREREGEIGGGGWLIRFKEEKETRISDRNVEVFSEEQEQRARIKNEREKR